MDDIAQAKEYFFAGLKAFNEADYVTAEINFEHSLAIFPNRVSSLINLTAVKIKLKKFEEAYELALQSIHLDQSSSESYLNLGLVDKEKKRYAPALNNFSRAIDLNHSYEEAWLNKGIILHELKKYDEAIEHYSQAILIKNDYSDAHFNQGLSYAELKLYDKALIQYTNAISFNPRYAEAFLNKGITLFELKQFHAALDAYDQAIMLKSDYVEAWSNKGLILHTLGLFDDAVKCYEKALSLNPSYSLASWNLALLLLLIGNFESGLKAYDSRWHDEKVSDIGGGIRKFTKPLWLGENSLHGKTILLFGEQGLGDTLQFCRYATLVAQLGAKVILEVQEPLTPLLKSIEGVSQVFTKGDLLPDFDYQSPLLSMPLAFKTTLTSIPSFKRYVYGNKNKIASWSEKLGKKTKFRIGVAWSSTSLYKYDHIRSILFSEFSQCLPLDSNKFEIICLQKVVKDADRDAFNSTKIRFYGDELIDFSDTACLVENLDLVISTCTSVPHLSCALGIPTWLLLSYVPDWRWLLEREDSPWYPSAKLYRQKKWGEWNEVLKAIKADLTVLSSKI